MIRIPVVVALFCLASTVITDAQAPGLPPRDSAARPQTGTARIRGRIVTAQTGQPVRRAQVMMNGPTSRGTTTDANGRYEFAGLPAGSFFISAVKPGYVRLQYGQRRPLEPGTAVVVAEGQTVERIDLALPRGSVITVRVSDDFGEPVIGAQIQALRFQYGPDGQRRLTMAPMSTPGGAFTDDRGEFRLFGLAPGEYVVSATLRSQSAGLPNAGDSTEGFAPTFYPGTMSADLAQAISVGIGEETSVQFAMVPSRLARVSGTVVDSQGRPAAGAMVQLLTRQGNGGSYSGGGAVAPDGSFSMTGIAPGEHSIEVRPTPRPGVPFNQLDGEFASMPIVVTGADIAGVRVVTGPGATINGRVVFDGGARMPANPMRVSLQPSDPGAAMLFMQNNDPARNGTIGIDNRFQITGAFGRVFVQLAAGGWILRSVMLDGRDITDEPLDLTGKASVSDVVITMTDRLSSVSGQVSDSRGPVPRYVVVLIPTDATETSKVARLTRTLRPNPEGRFQFRGLRPGRYVAAALESIEEGRQFAPEVREQLRRAGREFTVNEGETVTLDLKLAAGL